MKTERSGCLVLFGLPFFLVGIGFLFWSVIPTVYDGWRVQSWPAVSGQLIQADLTTNHSSDSTTHEARARYRYHISGREFTHDRVAINEGGDNIGMVGEAQVVVAAKAEKLPAVNNLFRPLRAVTHATAAVEVLRLTLGQLLPEIKPQADQAAGVIPSRSNSSLS